MSIEICATSSKLTWALSKFSEEERANLILILFSGEKLAGQALAADEATGGLISRRIEHDGFDPKYKQTRVIDTDLVKVPGLDKIILIGAGSRSKLTLNGLRTVLAEAFTTARDTARAEHLVFPLIDVDLPKFTIEQFAEVTAEYAILADYEPNHKKTRTWKDEAEQTHLKSLTVVCTGSTLSPAKRGIKFGQALGEATNKARDLVNEPSDRCNPKRIAEFAKKLAVDSEGVLTVKVLTKSAIKKLGMGGVLAVNQGSDDDACFIDLRYDPASGATEEVIGLVGKGITFDTGGLGIKDGDNMKDMKDDMGGAAAVLAAMSLLPVIKPKISVRAVVAATDNLISAKSMRPGDIITMMNGLTVQVDHTDAEGRLTLGDAIHYVQEHAGATKVIDLATLTGSVEEALGWLVSGVFSNDQRLANNFLAMANEAGEQMHQLPMPDEYADGNKCEMADLTNDGEGPGAIVAAFFLYEFVKPGVSWVHVDIAGTAFRRYEHGVDAVGATGVGTRTLAHYLAQWK